MIKVLQGLLDKISGAHPAKKSAQRARPRPGNTAGNLRAGPAGKFRAVSIAPSIMCCAAATRATGRVYLSREAPRLPLEACTMPASCTCKFLKNVDRREGDRRLFGAIETKRWYAGPDKRHPGCRRSSDLRGG